MNTAGDSSAQWDSADRVLFSWLDLPIEQIEQRVGELAHQDPNLAAALQSRLGQLRRFGLVGAAARDDGPGGHAPLTGRTFGGYEIVRLLGVGGMGSVYLAEQKSPRRQVALKVIRADRLDNPGARDRFQREARAVAALRDPGICTVLEVGDVEGTPFLAMQYIEGETLSERLAAQRAQAPIARGGSSSGPRTPADIGNVLHLIEKVARSLHVAHEAGVVHRDIKPGNLMIDSKGEPVLLDFGLARVDGDADEATLTRTGDVLGTPAYMSPEQLRPMQKTVDRRTDVYSLAATLFECMTLTRPFTGSSDVELFERILRDPTPDPRRHNPHVPADLGAVIGKAMEKEPARRYTTAAAFADDLARLRRHEPVQARRIGVLGRTARWARRHPVGAALIVVLGLSAATTGTLLYSSLQQRATISRTVADLTQRNDEFALLTSVVRCDEVMAAEKTLYPPWPDTITAVETWLTRDVAALLAQRPMIERVLGELRQRALPTSLAATGDPSHSPRFDEWQQLQKQVQALQRASAIRDGSLALQVPDLQPLERRGPAVAQLTAGWPGVDPDRTTFGSEGLGLAFARAALANVERGDPTVAKSVALNCLAWALAANGQDTEARTRGDEAIAAAPAIEREYWQQRRASLEALVLGAPDRLHRLQQRLTALEDEVHRTYRFEDRSVQHLHDRLVELQPKLTQLELRARPRVERRLTWARRIEELTRHHPRATHTWEEAAAAIAKADGEVASTLYQAHPIAHLAPQMGLVPIGMNPVTRLWEFYDLRSAYDGLCDPSAIDIPHHRADGAIDVRIDTGIVFVLVPGGTFTMGAQAADPHGANYDPDASEVEGPPQIVTLAPFFLARHELTQGQWLWLSEGGVPSQYRFGMVGAGEVVTRANPVEGVDWYACDALLQKHGMLLPTEAQWEYACRAGTSTPWFCDEQDLHSHCNLADQSVKAMGIQGTEPWDDGHVIHTRVGSYSANAFGMFDMHGNVAEWCRDPFGYYAAPVQAGDGLRLVSDPNRARRGGEWQGNAKQARSSARLSLPPNALGNRMGLRAARVLSDP